MTWSCESGWDWCDVVIRLIVRVEGREDLVVREEGSVCSPGDVFLVSHTLSVVRVEGGQEGGDGRPLGGC